MAKVKPARGKAKPRSRMRPEGVSCIILLISGFALLLFFLYFVMTQYAK